MRRLIRAIRSHIDGLLIRAANRGINRLRQMRCAAIQRQAERHIAIIEEETPWPSLPETTP